MPIHDWTRVDANLFHDFHQSWTIRIRDALNAGLLPPGYSALAEQHAGGLVPGVVGLQRRPRTGGPPEPRGGGVLTAPPKVQYAIRADATLADRANRIAIRHRMGRVVCIIEIVSPVNKSGRAALRSFIKKSIEFLEAGVHLLIVDLFPPSDRDPAGIHKAIWDEIEDRPFALPAEQPLTLAAYRASQPIQAYVQLVGVGEVLPDMPAYLSEDAHVLVPLEATYQTNWATCPVDYRDIVEGRLEPDGGIRIDARLGTRFTRLRVQPIQYFATTMMAISVSANLRTISTEIPISMK